MKQTSVSPLASLISTATLAALVAMAALAGAPALAQQPAPATTKPAPAAASAAPANVPAATANTPATTPAATPAAPANAPATAPASTPAAPASTAAATPGNDTAAAPAADAATVPATAATANDTTTAPNPARAPLGVPAAPYSNAATGGGLMQTTFALAFVIALLLGGAWVLKRFGPRSFGGGNNTVKLVGALSVGARERIIVVEVGEQWIVVGASPGRMNALATMARQEAPEVAPGSQPMAAPANFADWIKHTIDKRNNSSSKQ